MNTISLYSTSSYNSIKMSLNSTKKVQIGAMTIEPQNNILFWYNKRTRAIEGVDIAQNKLTTVYDRVTDDDQVTGKSHLYVTKVASHKTFFSCFLHFFFCFSHDSINFG